MPHVEIHFNKNLGIGDHAGCAGRSRSVTIAGVDEELIRERDQVVDRIRRELRALIRESGWTQRRVEEANGFTPGYMSQVLKGHITLTVRHLWGILLAIGVQPAEFVARVDGRNSAEELRERMDRYEALLDRLERQVVLQAGGPDHDAD